MAKSEILHIRVEPDVKTIAESTLNQLGLSTTEAVNIFLRQVILNGGLPFEVKLPNPNAETLAAMKEAKAVSKDKKGYNTMEQLMKDLDS